MREPYKSPKWGPVRRHVLERDLNACQLQLPKCKGYANTVHHPVDWADDESLAFVESNLVAACGSCNTSERNRRVAARARRARGDFTDRTYPEHW